MQEAALSAISDRDDAASRQILTDIAINASIEHTAKAAAYALEDEKSLLEVYEKSKYQEARKAAVLQLVDAVGDASLGTLDEILQKEQDPELRIIAVQALSDIGSDEVVPILARVAAQDSVIRIRKIAVRTLADIDTPTAKAALMKIIDEQNREQN